MVSGIMKKTKRILNPWYHVLIVNLRNSGSAQLQGLIPGAGKPKQGQQLPKKHDTEHHPGKQRHQIHGTLS